MKNKLFNIDLDSLIQESISALFETIDEPADSMKEKLRQQEKAKAAADRKKKSKGGDEQTSGDEADKIEPSKPVKLKQEKMPEINVKAVKDKINSIRAGKSLSDKETNQALTAYFEKLNGPERIALFAFLSGLEKILAKAAKDVKTPHSDPYNVDMAAEDKKKAKVKPQGNKSVAKNQDSENPIIVGEIADTNSIKGKLWR